MHGFSSQPKRAALLLPTQSGRLGALSLLLLFLTVPALTAQTGSLQERLENAAALIRENRIAEAEVQLQSLLKAAPNETAALNLLGALRAQQGRLNEAEILLTRAAKIDPDFVPVHMNLAFLYLLKSAPAKTIAELKLVIKLDPGNVEANYKLGRLLLTQGQIEEAISVLENARSAQSTSLVFAPLLGDAYLQKGDIGKAEENYLLVLGVQKNNVDAMLGMARISRKRGDPKATFEYVSQARERSSSAELLYKVGVTALELGVFDEAHTALEQAAQLKPDEPIYLVAFGAAEVKKSDLFRSEKLFRRAIELQPNNAQAQMYLGYVLYKQKKLNEARGYLEQAIKSDTGVPEPFYYLGLIVQEENDDERAIPLLERAIQVSPAFANAHVALGASYLKLKDYPRAQKELELGAKLNPDNSKAHYQLAVLYARLKDPKRAQAEMEIIEKLKALDQSGKGEGDVFVISPATPNPH
ncbi:MAG TPA: tetratricopeptide repeat protein [Pyrinomonadaceae bacterium]|nr:tetratricopeptide repeat protein [Pyrinomonadaceae bacterium]